MFARYHLNVHSTPTGEGIASIEFGGPRNIVVVASAAEDNKDTLVLIATAEFEPKENVLRVFQDLAAGVLPKDSEPYVTLTVRVEPGESLDKHIPSPDVLPDSFRSYSQMLRDEMSAATRAVASIYRWRTNTYPPSRRGFSTRGSQFSFDGETWHPIPSLGSGRTWATPHVRFDEDSFVRFVQPMVDAESWEPLGFELLAEAAELSESNRRGALVLAVAAVEVGFKSFIAELVPNAEWLAMNVPSPPVVQMLRDYLPKLPVTKALPSGKVLPPPDATLRVIKKAVQQRNQITHAGSETTTEFIDNALEAIEDTLRLLDYYRGHDWARTYMSYPFGVALGLREQDEHFERFYSED
jgi:hypothetical protein